MSADGCGVAITTKERIIRVEQDEAARPTVAKEMRMQCL